MTPLPADQHLFLKVFASSFLLQSMRNRLRKGMLLAQSHSYFPVINIYSLIYINIHMFLKILTKESHMFLGRKEVCIYHLHKSGNTEPMLH